MNGSDILFSFIDIKQIQERNEKINNQNQDFMTIYEKNPLFEHLILHLKSYLNKNSSSLAEKSKVECLSEFLKTNNFNNKILKQIIKNGIPNELPCLRAMLWKALIGYLPIDDLSQWKKTTLEHFKKYILLKKDFPEFPNNITNENDLKIIIQINKDLPRTRYEIDFFKEKSKFSKNETNYDILRRILYIYSKRHPDVSYVQGMNEILAIIYYIYNLDENPYIKPFIESDTYYSFEVLMRDIKAIFMMDNINYSQLFISMQIRQINDIISTVEPDLMKYFKKKNLTIDNFIMRWILVLFAQEFSLQTSIAFWDRLFTQKNKMRFICFISSAILIINKKKLMKMEMEEIIFWAQQFGSLVNDSNIDEIIKKTFEIKAKSKKKAQKHNFFFGLNIFK